MFWYFFLSVPKVAEPPTAPAPPSITTPPNAHTTPDFLRVVIQGEHSLNYMEDPKSLMFLRRALRKREHYMNQAFQSFPETTKKALHGSFKIKKKDCDSSTGRSKGAWIWLALIHDLMLLIVEVPCVSPLATMDSIPSVLSEPWDITPAANYNRVIKMVDGVLRVFNSEEDQECESVASLLFAFY